MCIYIYNVDTASSWRWLLSMCSELSPVGIWALILHCWGPRPEHSPGTPGTLISSGENSRNTPPLELCSFQAEKVPGTLISGGLSFSAYYCGN